MSTLLSDVSTYIEAHIDTFHQKRLEKLQETKLRTILKRKNPYLFKAKNILSAESLVKNILDAHLSSQEETIFGDFLEGVAIHVCSQVYQGEKSKREGIDLEFKREEIYYIVEIKSGPHWGNSNQIKRMRQNFAKASANLRQSYPHLEIVAVNGCCYGRDSKPDKGGYWKYCGQQFWSLISSDDDIYISIIKPLGHEAKRRNDAFDEAYYQIINQFTFELGRDFCPNGKIDWTALVKFASATEMAS